MFNLKSLIIVTVACLIASTQVSAECDPCVPIPPRDLSNVQVIAGRVCCT
ncbi:hypothetical protein C8F04DRAFT_1259487 [Mycena alexandri]|uniref:Uncharacterized protein n=1 Tax=Mycena alexandri TaxID=1745969 RepID=A0AAD6X313_9AGAR|nr:hypothetical protein C8F04DRAFT_1259487 [Mycena alexandri]